MILKKKKKKKKNKIRAIFIEHINENYLKYILFIKKSIPQNINIQF